jgi:hypothetical protein
MNQQLERMNQQLELDVEKLRKTNREMKQELFRNTPWARLLKSSSIIFALFCFSLVAWYWKGIYIINPVVSVTIVSSLFQRTWKRLTSGNTSLTRT